ncbi:C40 family peptidase, partial [Kocuria flava]|uniref:C40 family peptidase n=2 Tax=Kocuria TaxID=57493 RepID=UPI003F1AFA69
EPVRQAAPAPAAERTVTTQSSSSGKGATIASAARGQLGVGQDCTALVTNALRAAGINHHGWPASYLSLGTQVSAGQAQPGDLVYYADGGMGAAHIAVYIGGGKAVHGGWNGGTTVIDSVNVGSGPVFVRVR